MRPLPIAVCIFVAGGALAGLSISGLVPTGLRQAHLLDQDWSVSRPLEITAAKRFFVPFLFADFDLQMDVELGEGADLDLLVRQVEPRIVGKRLEPFPGRFCGLRMSTIGDGPGWRTREELLFGPAHGGVNLAAGHTASVWLQARGRELLANVAGRPQQVFTADDEYGMFTLLVHGGNAVLRTFVITNRGQPRAWLWARSTWAGLGALGALLVTAVGMVMGARPRWFIVSAAFVVVLAWLISRQPMLPLAWPEPRSMLCALAGCLVCPLWFGGGWRRAPALVAAALLLWLSQPGIEHDSQQVEAMFGPNSGAAASQALAQLLPEPDGPFGSAGLHTVDGPRPRVFLLGGQLLYNRGEPAEHLEFQLARELRAVRKAAVEVMGLPTVDGHTQQQWRLFSTYYTGYQPDVMVFGVPRDEAFVDAQTGRPRSDATALAATLRLVVDYCREHSMQLVLFSEAALPPELMAVVHTFEREGIALVVAADGASPALLARQLAAAVLPLLH